MCGTLGAIDQGRGAEPARQGEHLGNRVDRAQGVGDVHDGNDSGPLVEHGGIGVQVQFAGLVARDHPQHRAGAFGHQLPRHDIGVVFELADDDFVAGPELAAAVARRDQVDAFGRAAGPDDLLGRWCVEKCRHTGPRRLEGPGRAIAQGVRRAVDIGIVLHVVAFDDVENSTRFLGGGRVVQVDQGLAANLLMQDRKLCADGGRIEAIVGPCNILASGVHSSSSRSTVSWSPKNSASWGSTRRRSYS